MFSIGYDIGSSSVKAALVNCLTGVTIARMTYPEGEFEMIAAKEGWAEQDPEVWWKAICEITARIIRSCEVEASDIKSIGISYQMHGLVLVDKYQNVLRPSIIWCDSRAVEIGKQAKLRLGEDVIYNNLLNSPGNFTASKLFWVKENEAEIFEKIHKVMLPGDFINMKFSGIINTTISGLSEGIFWDFKRHDLSPEVLNYFDFDSDIIPDKVDNFAVQGSVTAEASEATSLAQGTEITYRAGDQPNNAMSLNVLHPGEIAATGGTSGVVYGIGDQLACDPLSRINSFAHINHSIDNTRIGHLLCINGAGSQYSWIKNQIAEEDVSFVQMEKALQTIPIGSEGLRVLPFGNGAERMIGNQLTGAQFNNVQFNIHSRTHFYRAALEGIAFSFYYGIKIFQELGMQVKKLKVGNDNLFLSDTFSQSLATLLNCDIDMMDTTGSIGAAKASGIAIGSFSSLDEAMSTITVVKVHQPGKSERQLHEAYEKWEEDIIKLINK